MDPITPFRLSPAATPQYAPTCVFDSLARADSLLFSSDKCVSSRPSGLEARLQPTTLRRDDVVGCVMMVGLAIFLFVAGRSKRRFRTSLADFFFPSNNQSLQPQAETLAERSCRVLLYILLLLCITVLLYLYADWQFHLHLMPADMHLLLLAFALLASVYMLLKWGMYHLVHWIFFGKRARSDWHRQSAFLFSLESLVLFPLTGISVFFGLEFMLVTFWLIIVLLFVKILLVWKAQRIFFPQFVSTFHLFAYLCGVEVTPYLLLWASLMATTSQLVSPNLG